MFDKILVPLDGSRLAESVLPHVVAVASAFGALVRLLHVLDSSQQGDLPADPLQWHLRKTEAHSYLDETQTCLEEMGLVVESAVEEGPAAQRIVDGARRHQSDLLILSSHGAGGLAQWNVSGVVEKVIQDVATSLLLVRAYQELPGEGVITPGYRRIMLPLDGSTRAEVSLPAAEILARYWDAELLLTHIIPRPRLFRAAPLNSEDRALLGRVVSRQRQEASDYFEKLQARLPVQSDVRIVVGGNLSAALEEIVEHDDVDLVLFSAHGHGCSRFQRYGSVVSCSILYGSVPLLIVQDLPAEQVKPTASGQALHDWEDEEIRRPAGTGPKPF